jgi:hypothetical protein
MVNPLSKVAREIVWGCLFGDGCVRKPSPTKQTDTRHCKYRNYKLQIRHSPLQRDYLYWLYGYLKPLCHSEPKEYRYLNKGIGKYYSSMDLVTRTHTYFTRLRKYFYPEGKKIIKRKNLNKLTPLGLAVWFMDDGTSDKKNRVWIATNSYSYSEHEIIQQYFKEVWNINVSIVKERNQFKISFNSDTKKFCDLIRPFIIPSMQYKLF